MAVTRINNNQITDASTGNIYVGVNAATKIQNYTVTSTKIANNLVYGSDLTVTGNLTVSGNTTTIDTTITTIEDPVILLASTQTGSPTVDIGFVGERGTANNIAFVWDESSTEFITAFTSTGETNTTIAISSYANFHTNDANIGGNIVINGTTSLVGNLVGAVNATGNITGGNLLTAGIVSAGGNITGANVNTAGQMSATGNVTGGNLSTAGQVVATGNITGGNVNTTNISLSGNVVSPLNVTGNITGGNLLTTGQVSAVGNISGGNLNVTTINGTNISMSGNVLAGGLISATGNVTGGNVLTAGIVSAGGNITGANVNTTNISLSGNVVSALNVTGNVTGANLVTGGLVTATGNVTGGNVLTAGQVSATGNVTGGNIVTTGNVNSNQGFFSGNVTVVGTLTSTSNIVANTSGIFFGNAVTGNNAILAGVPSFTSLGSNVVAQFSGNVNSYSQINFENINNGTLASTDYIATADNGTDTTNYADFGINSSTFNDPTNYPGYGPNDSYVHNHGGNLILNPESAGKTIKLMIGGTANADVVATVSNTGIAVVGVVSANGTVTGGNLATAGTMSASGNVTGGNVLTAGLVSAGGNVTGANVNTAGQVSATGNVTGGNLVTGGRVVATGNIVSSGNIAGGNLAVTGTITSATLETTGNVLVGGNLTVQGNIQYINVDDLRVEDPIIILGTGPNGAPLTADDGMDRGVYMEYYKTGLGNAFVGWENSSGNILVATSVNFAANNVVNVLQYGTLQAGNLYVQSSSVIGNVQGGNLNTAGQVSATANITGGNLVSGGLISATGTITSGANVTGANLVTGGLVTATGNVTGGNVNTVGIVSASGTVTGGNLATAGTASAGGNVTGANLVTGGLVTATGNIIGGNVNTAGQVSATANVTGGNLLTGGIVSSTGNILTGANILASGFASITGNVTGGNVNTGGLISATGNVTGGNINTSGVVLATGNVTGGNLNTAGSISSTGNITSGNISTGIISASGNVNGTGAVFSGNVSAQNFIGNISGNIDAGGANTNIQFNDGDVLAGSAAFTFDKTSNAVVATGNITGGNLNTGGQVVSTGNVTGGNLITLGLATVTGNVIGGNLNTAGQVVATGNVNGGNVVATALVTGANVSATSNVTGANVVGTTSGTFANIRISTSSIDSSAGRITINGADADVDFAVDGDTVANVFYVDAGTGTASFGSSTQTTGAVVAFNASNSILMPVGNTAQRPAGVLGMLRFNSIDDGLEVYTAGGWETVGVPVFTVISDEQFNGDGSTVVFTLGSSQTTASCIVSINGVVQLPTVAYSVSGTTLTFTEAPLAGDVIDVRQITTTTTVVAISNTPGTAVVAPNATLAQTDITGNLIPVANVAYDLGSSTLRWRDGYFAGNSITLGNTVMKNTSGNTIGFFGPDGTTPATIASTSIDTTSIANGTSSVSVIASGGNIRSNVGGTTVQTISAGLVAITGDLSVTGNATLSGNILGDRVVNGTTSFEIQTPSGNANISVGGTSNVAVFTTTGLNVAGTVSVLGTGNITGANLIATADVFTPEIVKTGSNAVGNIGQADNYFNRVFAQATSALYADLAEKYVADAEYAPGTVVVFGGSKEVTVSSADGDTKVAGVVSTNPSYIMNSGLEAEHVATVALTGRVPTRVTGTVRKGDLMVSAGYGLARAEPNPRVGTVIGKAIEDFNGQEGVIEVVVGRF